MEGGGCCDGRTWCYVPGQAPAALPAEVAPTTTTCGAGPRSRRPSPAVTGQWRLDLPAADMVRLDLRYVENWPLMLDL